MNLKNFDPIRYPRKLTVRDHLQAIARYTNEVAGLVGNQSEPVNPNIHNQRVDTWKTNVKFPGNLDGQSIGRDHQPKDHPWTNDYLNNPSSKPFEAQSWDSTQTRGYRKLDLKDLYETDLSQQKTGIQGHLAEIRQHTQAALNLLGNSPPAPPPDLPQDNQPKLPIGNFPLPKSEPEKSEPGNPIFWIAAVLFIVVLLGYCSEQDNQQESQPQERGLLRDIPVLVEFVGVNRTELLIPTC
ncbi:MAG: hypothetical protein LDL41_21960 [Coleofasciculus sp. S288]|nr:hypothetical protein [Coleofasciculus sp. S288]